MEQKYYRSGMLALVLLFAPTLVVANTTDCTQLGSVNLVQNCGFETGDFTGWTEGNALDPYVGVSFASSAAHSGDYYAALGSQFSDNSLYQDLTTQVGEQYVFAFYLASDGEAPSDFTARWNGNVVFSEAPVPNQDYTLESFLVTATSTTTRIEFDFRNDPGWSRLDDVEVFVPEPSGSFWGALLLGCPLFGFLRLGKSPR